MKTENILIIGGLALGAYLLFKNNQNFGSSVGGTSETKNIYYNGYKRTPKQQEALTTEKTKMDEAIKIVNKTGISKEANDRIIQNIVNPPSIIKKTTTPAKIDTSSAGLMLNTINKLNLNNTAKPTNPIIKSIIYPKSIVRK